MDKLLSLTLNHWKTFFQTVFLKSPSALNLDFIDIFLSVFDGPIVNEKKKNTLTGTRLTLKFYYWSYKQ